MIVIRVLALLFIGAILMDSEDIDPATSFAKAYNNWIMLRQTSQPYILNIRELQAWQETRDKWKALNKVTYEIYHE